MNRRRFLVLSGVGVLVIGSTYYLTNSITSLGDGVFVPQHLPRIMDAQMIEEIGEEFISANYSLADEAKIKSLLADNGVDSTISYEELNNIVVNNFNSENTFLGKGWVLSETEILQCALYYLNN